jgi:hypothetical protein
MQAAPTPRVDSPIASPLERIERCIEQAEHAVAVTQAWLELLDRERRCDA